MALTRFKDARAGYDGPVSGSLVVIPVSFQGAFATNTTSTRRLQLPAGMKIRVVDVKVRASAVTSDPSITIGSSTTASALVAAVNLTTNLGALTLKSAGRLTAAAGNLVFTIVNDTGDSFSNAEFTVVAHVADPPDSVDARGPEHY